MSLISVNHLTFYYEGSSDNIFEDVSFQIDTDWKLGFIARNGRGKTTFLKLLMGAYEYRGSIASEESFDYFPFEVKDMEKTVLEIVEELYPDYEFWKLCRELTLLHVDADVLYRAFSTLSNGERTKVMLAVLFSRENQFLLIDEPTNHLDQEGRASVREYLKGKKGFILVSHDRDFLDQCVDHVLVINRTNIEVYKGNFSVWWEEKQRKDAWEQAENERLKQDIRRLESSARVKEQWADALEARKLGKKAAAEAQKKGSTIKGRRPLIGEKSRKMQRRRKNLEHRKERAIEEKEGLLKNLETTEDLKLFPLRHHKEILVSLSEVRIFYEQPDGGRKVLPEAEFRVNNGDCVVLKGRNGCGKSSILNALDPEFNIQVGDVSQALGRGRHTTRHVELFHLNCGADVVDSPGFSSFETDELNLELKHRLPETFVEFRPYLDQCRFVGCSHTKEKGCAVLEAVRDGTIQKSRHASYIRLYEELKPLQDWQEKKR